MTKKVEVAVFDKDLRVRTLGKFPLSQDGTKIVVKKGGKGNFAPTFDNESFIELPKRFGGWRRIYLVRKGAKSCVNFQTEDVKGPDPELVIEAAESEILRGIGKEKEETPIILYLIFGGLLLALLKLFGVIV